MKTAGCIAMACAALCAANAWAQTATPSTSTSGSTSATFPITPSAAGSTTTGTVGSDVQRIGPTTDWQQRDPVVGPSQFYDRYDDAARRQITIDGVDAMDQRRQAEARRVMQRVDDLDQDALSRGTQWIEESRRRSEMGREEGFTVYGTDDPRWTQDPRQGYPQRPGTVGETVLGDDQRRDARGSDSTGRGGRAASLFILQPANTAQFDARRPEEAALPLDVRLGDGQQIMVIGTVIDPARPVQFAAEIRQIARLGTDDGQMVLIDLGRGNDPPNIKLRPGDRLTVIGGADRIDNQLTVRATHVGNAVPVR